MLQLLWGICTGLTEYPVKLLHSFNPQPKTASRGQVIYRGTQYADYFFRDDIFLHTPDWPNVPSCSRSMAQSCRLLLCETATQSANHAFRRSPTFEGKMWHQYC